MLCDLFPLSWTHARKHSNLLKIVKRVNGEIEGYEVQGEVKPLFIGAFVRLASVVLYCSKPLSRAPTSCTQKSNCSESQARYVGLTTRLLLSSRQFLPNHACSPERGRDKTLGKCKTKPLLIITQGPRASLHLPALSPQRLPKHRHFPLSKNQKTTSACQAVMRRGSATKEAEKETTRDKRNDT